MDSKKEEQINFQITMSLPKYYSMESAAFCVYKMSHQMPALFHLMHVLLSYRWHALEKHTLGLQPLMQSVLSQRLVVDLASFITQRRK